MTTVTSEFDQAIALSPEGPDSPGRYRGELGAGWQIGGGINGGLLLAVAANALRQELPEHPDPVSISAYYLSTSRPGPLTVQTEVIRRGRGLSNATASLSQPDEDGRPVERLRVVAGCTDLAALEGDVRTSAVAPQLPPVEQCFGREHAPMPITPDLAFLERFEMRFDPATVGWAVGQPSGNGRIQAWFRLADGREPDPLALLLAADALPPVTYDLGIPGWAPTVELTVHLRAVPAKGWLRISHGTRNLAGGYFEEDCEIWDEAGRLVAQSRQLARVPRQA